MSTHTSFIKGENLKEISFNSNQSLSLLRQKIVYYSRSPKKFTEKNKFLKRKESISFAGQQFKNLAQRRLRIPIKLFHL